MGVCNPAYSCACLKTGYIGRVVAGRASGVKVGDDGGCLLISSEGVTPSWTVGVCTSVIFPCTIKIQKIMVGKSTIVGYHPVGAPTCLRKQEVGKPSQNAAQPCAKAEGCVHDDLKADKLRKGWGFWVGTWNVDSLTGRAGELVEALADREVDVGCIQETRWRGSGCKFFGAQGKTYKLFWMGGKDRSDGIGMFVAEKWVDSLVKVERHSERVLILKMVLDISLNVLTVYAPHSGKPEEEK